jgi:hypothetical protein
MDRSASFYLRLRRHITDLPQEQNWFPCLSKHSGTRRGWIYPWRHLHTLNLVYTQRAGETSGYLFLRDVSILRARLEREDSEKKGGAQGMRIPLKVVWKTLGNYRRWPHYLATACVFSTWSPLTTYTPSIMLSVIIA